MARSEIADGVSVGRRQHTADTEALAEFCYSHHRRLVGLLALYTGDRWVAEELAQESFEKLCRNWPKVRRMESATAWVNSVAINLANSMWRRRRAEHRARARHGPASDVLAEDTATVIAVRKAVAALPRRQRAAIVLRYYAGMSVAETARAMDCAEGTVKSLTNRAVTGLRGEGLIEMRETPNES